MKKEALNHLKISFIKQKLSEKVIYSLVSSFIMSFLLMIIFNLHNNLRSARLFFALSFIILFIAIFLFTNSQLARTSKYTHKKQKFTIEKKVSFKLKDMHKILSYIIIIILILYSIFLIMWTSYNFSEFGVFLTLILLFTTIIYFILFFYHKFHYYVCKKGLLIHGIHLPKFYTWHQIKHYKRKKRIIHLHMKKTKYHISIPHKKGVEKHIKKHVKKK
tara:strand:+ start:9409 stop:10062 length:654 start_codon:yes stop_codon:yes gene_type:complete